MIFFLKLKSEMLVLLRTMFASCVSISFKVYNFLENMDTLGRSVDSLGQDTWCPVNCAYIWNKSENAAHI